MTDDELIAKIRDRAAGFPTLTPVATEEDLARTEATLGFALPSFYRRLLLEVGNGGFGPTGGLYGVPPDGYFDSIMATSIVDAYRMSRDPKEELRGPRGVVFLCEWGCGKFSFLDCESEEGAVLTWDEVPGGDVGYWQTAPSLRAFMREWVERPADADLTVDVTGERLVEDPITGRMEMSPVTELRGPQVDLSERRRR